MKRKISLLLSAIMLLSGCSNVSNPESSETAKSEETTVSTTESKMENVSSEPTKTDSSETEPIIENDTKKELVAYFSRTNNTERIAEYIVDITGADSYEIEAAVPYTDEDIEYNNSSCRANREQNDKSVRPEIANPIGSLEQYDIIYLGYPIWWGEEPRIIDTFLESYDFSDKTVIPFCTSGSSGIGASESNISKITAIKNQPEGRRFSAGASENEVKEWVNSLKLSGRTEEKLYLTVNGTKLSVTLEENSSVNALKEKLSGGDIVIDAKEYSGFEKVGSLVMSRSPVRIGSVAPLNFTDNHAEFQPRGCFIFRKKLPPNRRVGIY